MILRLHYKSNFCFNFHYQFRFHFPDAQFSQDSAHLEILFKEKQLNWQTFQFLLILNEIMVKLGTTSMTKACLVLDAGMSFAFTKESDGVNLEIELNIVINMIS